MKFTASIIICALLMVNVSCTSNKDKIENKNVTSEEGDKEEIKFLKYSDVYKIKKEMTYKEVISLLGPCRDIGSGRYIYVYKLEDGKEIVLNFGGMEEVIGKSGEEILKEIKDK